MPVLTDIYGPQLAAQLAVRAASNNNMFTYELQFKNTQIESPQEAIDALVKVLEKEKVCRAPRRLLLTYVGKYHQTR